METIISGKEASWTEARDRELAHWSAIREAIGSASPVELLTEINAADAFCDKAKQETVEIGSTPHAAGEPCPRCLFYQQFGGCRETSGRMSESVAAHDWEGLRAQVEEVIAHLHGLAVPAAA
jgi:hypothetical protein